jgi:eukaryotic-like serine/threonine-protein kinase
MPDESGPDEQEGTFGAYDVVTMLGQGGMADVLLASKSGPGGFLRLVVIKRLREHLSEDPELAAMLMDEARLAARLDHPHIVRTYEAGKVGRQVYLAMEYLEGQALVHVVRRCQRTGVVFPLELQLLVLIDVLAALECAHGLCDLSRQPLHVVHRDVSPSNVFVTYEGIAKLVDFGIAKAAGRAAETKVETVKGKTTYMAPEQAQGRPVDGRADVFSVGVMLWESCVGRRMWGDESDIVILGKLIRGHNPRSARAENSRIDAELDAICVRALAPDPAERYSTAIELHDDLLGYMKRRGFDLSRRPLGQFVARLFTNEREALKARIDRRLSQLASRGSSRPTFKTSSSRLRASRRNRKQRSRLLALAGLALASGVGLWILWPGPASIEPNLTSSAALLPPSGAAPSVEQARPTVEHPEPRVVRIFLSAAPESAQFSIDGGEWLANPHESERPSTSAAHELRVRADGYEEKSLSITFDKDVFLEISLDRKPRARPRPQPPPKPPPPVDPWGD